MGKKKTAEAAPAELNQPPVTATGTTEVPPEPVQPANGNGHATNGNGNGNGEGNGEKRHPVYKVGPIPTDKDNSVEAAVWDRVVSTGDGRTFTVYSVTCHANWRDKNGEWNRSNNFRGSQLYALLYCLQRASDWILSMRDQSCPI